MAMTAVPSPDVEPVGLDNLTAAETAMAERKAAQSITTLGSEGHPQAGLIGALGWVLHLRSERLTYERYMESRTLAEITRELGLSDDDEPATEAEAEGKGDGLTSPS